MNDTVVPVSELPADPEALLAALAALEHPPTGTSWLVYVLAMFAACLAGIALWIVWTYLRRRRNSRKALAWRPEVERRLVELRARVGAQPALDAATQADILADASVLARQMALLAEPRTEVASLSGNVWLERLDALAGGGQRFSQGLAQSLADGPYQAQPAYSKEALLEILDGLQNVSDATATRLTEYSKS